MVFFQEMLILKARKRGFHLITEEVIEAMQDITFASLIINENADATVHRDYVGERRLIITAWGIN